MFINQVEKGNQLGWLKDPGIVIVFITIVMILIYLFIYFSRFYNVAHSRLGYTKGLSHMKKS
jgi:hypothetical protein